MAAITTATEGEILVVRFLNRRILDRQQVEQVGHELLDAIPKAVHNKLLLNFDGVFFIASAMITKLVTLNRTCKEQGVHLTLCDVSPNVMEVFRIARLNQVLDIQDS